MLLTRTLIMSTLTLLANAQIITTDPAMPTFSPGMTIPTDTPGPTPTPAALPTRVIASLEKYYSSLEAQPEWSSAVQALTSAIPASILSQIENDPTDYLSSIMDDGTAPGWVSAVPTSYISYFSSIAVAEASITSKAAQGPAPTNGPRVKVVGAALVVGAAGLALL